MGIITYSTHRIFVGINVGNIYESAGYLNSPLSIFMDTAPPVSRNGNRGSKKSTRLLENLEKDCP